MFLLLTRYHYWLDNIDLHILFFHDFSSVNVCFKFHGKVASKAENLVFYHDKTVLLYAESSAEKFVFFDSSKKFSYFVEDIARERPAA